jgi:hypothetical protein
MRKPDRGLSGVGDIAVCVLLSGVLVRVPVFPTACGVAEKHIFASWVKTPYSFEGGYRRACKRCAAPPEIVVFPQPPTGEP